MRRGVLRDDEGCTGALRHAGKVGRFFVRGLNFFEFHDTLSQKMCSRS